MVTFQKFYFKERAMQKLNNRHGFSPVGVIVGLIVLVLAVGAIWYLVSKPFKQQVNDTITNNTEWTPERIRKDPVLYLSWAIGEVNKTEGKLQASKLDLTAKEKGIKRSLERARAAKADGETRLAELRKAYKTTDANNSCRPRSARIPTARSSWEQDSRLQPRNREHAREFDAYTENFNRLEAKLAEIGTRLSEVTQLRTKFSTDKSMAESDKTVEGIESIGGQVASIKDMSDALTSVSGDGGSGRARKGQAGRRG